MTHPQLQERPGQQDRGRAEHTEAVGQHADRTPGRLEGIDMCHVRDSWKHRARKRHGAELRPHRKGHRDRIMSDRAGAEHRPITNWLALSRIGLTRLETLTQEP